MIDAIVIRTEIYDEMGWSVTSDIDEGYDINGWPVSRVVGTIIDGNLFFLGNI